MKKNGLNLKKKTILNNTYIIRKYSLNDALHDIAEFEERMEKFIKKHKSFKYTLNLESVSDDEWVVKINIQNRNEQSDTEVFKNVTGTHGIL